MDYHERLRNRPDEKDKILLVLLPYWSPLIPPLGISCLKGYLQENGFKVTGADANVEPWCKKIYEDYFGVLEKIVPAERQGNFYSIGMDVCRNHLMAHLRQDRGDYQELLPKLVESTFYCDIDEDHCRRLCEIVAEFYEHLESYFLGLLNREKPSVLGLSVFSGSLPASLFCFELAKRKDPGILTVMGGGIFADDLKPGSPNFERFMATTPFIDKVIVGEGELLFLRLLRGELSRDRKFHDLQELPEVFDIETASLPDFSDFDLDLYPSLAAYTSRSCPFQCSFCSETISWGTYRKKSGARIVQEMTELYERYGYQLFLMGDSLLNPVIRPMALELEKSDLPLYWDGYLRADPPVTVRENALLWRRAGFYRARLGIESGSQHVLDLMHKKIKTEQIKKALSSLAAAGVKTTTYWVAGHPGETEEDFQKTLDMIEEMQDDIWEAECSAFNYYYSGQVDSEFWAHLGQSKLLYPEKFNDMLVMSTWILETEPSRREIYDRVSRFVEHCRKLGVPNPYTMHEIYQADERWASLHRDAVPPLVEFKQKDRILDENKNVQGVLLAKNTNNELVDWAF